MLSSKNLVFNIRYGFPNIKLKFLIFLTVSFSDNVVIKKLKGSRSRVVAAGEGCASFYLDNFDFYMDRRWFFGCNNKKSCYYCIWVRVNKCTEKE
ncbi:MAG: hypothetical protein ACTSRA_02300 [Promethearchaeota archaeon]